MFSLRSTCVCFVLYFFKENVSMLLLAHGSVRLKSFCEPTCSSGRRSHRAAPPPLFFSHLSEGKLRAVDRFSLLSDMQKICLMWPPLRPHDATADEDHRTAPLSLRLPSPWQLCVCVCVSLKPVETEEVSPPLSGGMMPNEE